MLQPEIVFKNSSNGDIPNNLRPIAYVSTLSQTESNYSYIESELLGVVFSCLQCKHFAHGRKITDHKPVSLFKKKFRFSISKISQNVATNT